MEIAYIVIILFMRVVQSFGSKSTSKLFPEGLRGRMAYGAYYMGIAGLLAFILAVLTDGFSKTDMMTILYAGISGIGLATAFYCSLLSMQTGMMALTTLAGTAGLLIPTIAGIFLFNTAVSPMQWIAVTGFFVASYIIVGGAKKTKSTFNFKTVLLLIGTLCGDGITMLMQTAFKNKPGNNSVTVFSTFTFLIPAMIIFLSLLCSRMTKRVNADNENRLAFPKPLLVWGIVNAVAVFVINQLATTSKLAPILLFSIINGGYTVIASIVGMTAFKEKLNIQTVIGLIGCIAALILIKL